MLGCSACPGTDRVFFHSFDPSCASNAAPIGQDRQCLRDVFLRCASAIEEGAPSDSESASAGLAQPSLGAGLGKPEVDQVASIHLTVVGTLFIGAEGASLSYLRCRTHALPFTVVIASICL